MEFKDYYKIIGVDRKATQDEIKRAYRKLARKYHPDVSKETDAEDKFKELGEAYEVLKDPEKRAAYDQLGSQWQAGQQFDPPPGWDAGFEFRGGGYTEAGGQDYSDFFSSLFGHDFAGGFRQSRHGGYAMRGQDHHARILIDIEDSIHGGTRSITLRTPTVDASGHVTTRQRQLNVRIPKGVTAGQKIRLAGQGDPGQGGQPAGDLYLEIEFRPHPYYRVEGADLYLDLPIAPWEAALGTSVRVPTPTGAVDMKIPAGAVSGKRLRLKGKGLPAKPPGDLYAVLQIVVPPAKDETARKLYQEMADKLSFNPRQALGV